MQSACVQETGGQQRCSKSHLHFSRLNGVSGYQVEHYSCSWRQGATESASGLRETARGIQEGYAEPKRYCYNEVYNQTILESKKGDQKKKDDSCLNCLMGKILFRHAGIMESTSAVYSCPRERLEVLAAVKKSFGMVSSTGLLAYICFRPTIFFWTKDCDREWARQLKNLVRFR